MSNYTQLFNMCQGISNIMSININFLTIRKKLGLNQTEYAEKLDSSQNLISKYEKGQVEVPFKIINNLHKILNININWFLTNKGDMFFNENNEKLSQIDDNLEEKRTCTSIEKELTNDIKQLSSKRQQYYYHRVKADLIDEEM